MNNLANFDTKLLEKAYKRKLAESGDSVDPGPSTSKTQWSHDDIDAAQQVLRLGDKQTLELAHLIREKENRRDAVESNVGKNLVAKKNLLSDYYEVKNINYQFGKKSEDIVNKEIPTAFCHDIPGLIRFVSVHRNLNDENLVKKIGVDSGKGIQY